MLIGSYSHIPYRQFAGTLAPVAAVGLGLAIAVLYLIYRREFRDSARWSREACRCGCHDRVVLRPARSQGRDRPLEGDLESLAARLGIGNVFVLSAFSAVLSNLVSNVPTVPWPGLAHVGDVIDPGRKPHRARLSREPDRDPAGQKYGGDRVLAVLSGRCTPYHPNAGFRGSLDSVVLKSHLGRRNFC